MLQVVAPHIVAKARKGLWGRDALFQVLRLREKPDELSEAYPLHVVWSLVTWDYERGAPLSPHLHEARTENFGSTNPKELLRDVIAETLDVFELST